MKKSLPILIISVALVFATWFAATGTAIAQNVGIGTAAPAAKLEVDGGFAVRPVTLVAGANITVPTNETVVRITNDAANVAIAVAAPATATEGQFLSIRNEDATNTATFAGTAIPAGQIAEFMYLNGGWRFSNGTANTDWGLAGNAGTVAGTHFIGTTDNVPLQFRVNNTQAARLTSGGHTVYGAEAGLNSNSTSLVAVGYQAATAMTTGSSTVAVGREALVANVAGSNNSAVGFRALVATTAGNNTALGREAGAANTTGTSNTFLGYLADAGAPGLTNATAIGTRAQVDTDNALVLGSVSGVNGAGATANVGIGVNSPAARLHIRGAYANSFSTVAAAAAPALPSNASHVRITLTAAANANALAAPATPVEGQVLTIVNEDNDAATFAGATVQANGGVGSFIYANGVWRAASNSDASANDWGLTGNSGTVAGTHFIGTTDNVALQLRVNNTQAGRLTSLGQTVYGAEAGINSNSNSLTAIGYQAANALTTGTSTVAVGYQAALLTTTGSSNTAVGREALESNVAGSSNTAVGLQALAATTAGNNTAVGREAGAANTTGTSNTYLGYLAEAGAPDLNNATAVGARAQVDVNNAVVLGSVFGVNGAGATANVGIGLNSPAARLHIRGAYANSFSTVAAAAAPALPSNASHVRLTFTAAANANALAAPATPVEGQVLSIVNDDNDAATFAGATVQANGGVGSFIYANGVWRAASNSDASLSAWGLAGNSGTVAGTHFIGTTDNVALQLRVNNTQAGRLTSLGQTVYGAEAGINSNSNTLVAIGYQAANALTTGISTVAVGFRAALLTTTGSSNTAVGREALESNVAGSNNTAVGFQALGATTAGNNTAVGREAGAANTTGTNNTYLGYLADAGVPGLTNATAVGAHAQVDSDNAVVLGSVNGVNGATANANVGISITAPASRLHLRGAITNQPGTMAASATPFVFNNIGNIRLTAVAGVQANDIAPPPTPQEGQMLNIINEDDNNANFLGTTIYANGGVGSFVYAGGAWRTISSGNAGGNDWGLAGNSGTVAGTHFIGTTDNVALQLRVNNLQAGRLSSAGQAVYGALAGENSTSNSLVAVGFQAGRNVTGAQNVLVGNTAAAVLTSGQRNVSVGAISASALTIGSNNTLVGYNVAPASTTAANTTCMGYQALLNNTMGNNNTAFGYLAGETNTVGYDNMFIGYRSDAATPNLTNATAIGNRAQVNISNALVLGGVQGINGATVTPYVGIGTPAPERNLHVEGNNDDHLMTLDNNTLEGDGLLIRLQGIHPRWNGTGYSAMPLPSNTFPQFNVIKAQLQSYLVNGNAPSLSDIPALMSSMQLQNVFLWGTCQMTNTVGAGVINLVNSGLGLPWTWGFYVPWPIEENFGFTLQGIPAPSLPCGAISGLNMAPTFQMPAFNGPANSLSTENEFITFADQDGRWCGAVTSTSIAEWEVEYLTDGRAMELISAFMGIDPADILGEVYDQYTQIAEDYNGIGVVYASGNGDYAEWLERQDSTEHITFGDIVGVRGGRITRDLTNADQVMVVSKAPIVRGNAPAAAREWTGNNVAFMGQVPVKVMGPVQVGDYIIGGGPFAGFGYAKSPSEITPEEFTRVVGRAWEAASGPGAKLVNTVVGLHNGEWVRVVREQQNRVQNLESDVNALRQALETEAAQNDNLEQRLDRLERTVPGLTPTANR